MKILVLGSSGSRWEKEFVEHVLLPLGHSVYIAGTRGNDPFRSYYEGNCEKYIPAETASPVVMKIPKVRAEVMLSMDIASAKKYMPYDIILDLFVCSNALRLADALRSKNTRVIAYFCGSDILRAEGANLFLLRRTLKYADSVYFASEQVKAGYNQKIGCMDSSKCAVVHLGISVFGNIDKLQLSGISAKEQLGIPENLTCICVGYNGYSAQQHIPVLTQIGALPLAFRDRLFLLLPMTYGGTDEYILQVDNSAKGTGCQHLILKSFLDNEGMARLHCTTDIMINAQISDGLSASVLESLYSRATLISAKWLDYPEYHKWGLDYITFDEINDLPKILINAVNGNLCKNEKNHERLKSEMSWEQTWSKWKAILDG